MPALDQNALQREHGGVMNVGLVIDDQDLPDTCSSTGAIGRCILALFVAKHVQIVVAGLQSCHVAVVLNMF